MSKGKKYNIPRKYLHNYPVRKWNKYGCRRRYMVEKAIEAHLSKALLKENFQLEQLTFGLKYPQSIVEAVNAKNEKAQKAQNELAVVKAEANKLRTQALTPLILKQQWIDKWNGTIPIVITGGNTSAFLDLSKMGK